MKAAVIHAPKGKISVEQRARPNPGAGEVLIRVRACGICHGDLMLQSGEFPFARYPIVPGHEVVGVVEEVSEQVTQAKPGDRVAVSVLFSSCGTCGHCLRGAENLCPEWVWTGVMRDGGYQEFMIARASYVARLPETLDSAQAAPLMCAGLTVYSGLRQSGFRAGQKIAVVGLGGLGEMGVLYGRAMGGRVAVVSTSPEKRAEALEMGAERFICTANEEPGAALRAWDGGADVILATAPSVDSMNAVLPGLARDGTMVVLGVGSGEVRLDPMALVMARWRVMGSPAGSRNELQDALDLAAACRLKPRVERFPLERAEEALGKLHEGRLRGRAVLVMEA